MTGLTILDQKPDGRLAVSLASLLGILESYVRGLRWVASQVEAVGAGASQLHDAADRHQWLSFNDLLRLAEQVDQVIDGEFTGYDAMGRQRLVIRAVDSTAFDVESDEGEIPRILEAHFQRTRRYDRD